MIVIDSQAKLAAMATVMFIAGVVFGWLVPL